MGILGIIGNLFIFIISVGALFLIGSDNLVFPDTEIQQRSDLLNYSLPVLYEITFDLPGIAGNFHAFTDSINSVFKNPLTWFFLIVLSVILSYIPFARDSIP